VEEVVGGGEEVVVPELEGGEEVVVPDLDDEEVVSDLL